MESAITVVLLIVAGYAVVSRRVTWRGKFVVLAMVGYMLVGGELVASLLSGPT
jgi:hypothetical protein